MSLSEVFLTLMVMGIGLGIISSWAHSDTLVRLLDRKARLALFTSIVIEPFEILAIFSDKGMSRSGGSPARARAGLATFSLSSRIWNTLASGADKILSDQVLLD